MTDIVLHDIDRVLLERIGRVAKVRGWSLQDTLLHLLEHGLFACESQLAARFNDSDSQALQAAIAVCHARATVAEDTDWERITALYDGLARISPSPVVELNRGVATAQAFGPRGRPGVRAAVVRRPGHARLPPAVRGLPVT